MGSSPSEIIRNYMEMYKSLCDACNNAGGTPPPVEDMGYMSAQELLAIMCVNNIRFVFKEGRKVKNYD